MYCESKDGQLLWNLNEMLNRWNRPSHARGMSTAWERRNRELELEIRQNIQ